MKKIKRSYNGMTLVEVLVALAVFTIISALLASACAGICTIMRKTNRLNKKISNETPDAELKNDETIIIPSATAAIRYSPLSSCLTFKGPVRIFDT